ncbi:MAG: hypothetical protein FWD68_10415 [Alphaproteobacteria bacterium]|nr:hypothetical protein [Alphaproteobacteria bacterium]
MTFPCQALATLSAPSSTRSAGFCYRITIPLESALAGNLKLDDIRARMGAEPPSSGTGWPGVEFPEPGASFTVGAQGAVRHAFGFGDLRRRGPIWDIAALGPERVGVVHDDCHLEIVRRDGTVALITGPEGYGVQVFAAPVPMVHVGSFRWKQNVPEDTVTRATLCRIEDETLHPIVSCDRACTFSVSQDGLVLVRGPPPDKGRKSVSRMATDVILNPATGTATRCNLGHFDVFNNFLRIDGAPHLFFVQGTPPDNPARQYLCSIAPNGTVRRHWPVLVDDGKEPNCASHAMECSFAWLRDKAGEALVAAGRHWTGRADCKGFFYRRDLPSGREAWRHVTGAVPAAIKCVPGRDIVLAAFLDGGLWAVRSDTGRILHQEMFATDGQANVIFSFDVDPLYFYFGLLDGRYGRMPLASLGL